MSDLSQGNKGSIEIAKQSVYDDAPVGLTTTPIQGYTAINSREKAEVIERIAPVLPKNIINKGLMDQKDSSNSTDSTTGGYGNLNKAKGYGNLSGRSSLLQQRLKSGSIQRFDSGEHFRQQAQKTLDEQEEKRLDNRPHPLTNDATSSGLRPSSLASSVPSSREEKHQLQSGHIGRLRQRPVATECTEIKPVERTCNRFTRSNCSEDGESD